MRSQLGELADVRMLLRPDQRQARWYLARPGLASHDLRRLLALYAPELRSSFFDVLDWRAFQLQSFEADYRRILLSDDPIREVQQYERELSSSVEDLRKAIIELAAYIRNEFPLGQVAGGSAGQ